MLQAHTVLSVSTPQNPHEAVRALMPGGEAPTAHRRSMLNIIRGRLIQTILTASVFAIIADAAFHMTQGTTPGLALAKSIPEVAFVDIAVLFGSTLGKIVSFRRRNGS